jgi:predicted ATPase
MLGITQKGKPLTRDETIRVHIEEAAHLLASLADSATADLDIQAARDHLTIASGLLQNPGD